jgi:hypothetical protein
MVCAKGFLIYQRKISKSYFWNVLINVTTGIIDNKGGIIMGISVSDQVDEIIDMYEILEDNDEAEIRRFIEERDYLFPIIKEAKGQILSVFGDYVKLYLELYHDIEEGWEKLFIIIKSPYSAEKALELERILGKKWFLNKIKEAKGDLIISEENYEF